MNVRAVVKGALTFVPGMQAVLPKARAGNHPPAAYFYGVWLKHLTLLAANGFTDPPLTVAELGPGDTFGLGLAALLCGANSYYGLDIVAHTDRMANLPVLAQLVDLLESRAPRPSRGWPDFDHLLDVHLFPSSLLTEARLRVSLDPNRIQRIRSAIEAPDGRSGEIELSYRVPWHDSSVIAGDSVDLILSQAVLEHVGDVRATYAALYRWLKPGAVMSHQIDFRSHNLTETWNGYRAISEPVWTIMAGRRPYLINRVPCSGHLAAMEECGFEIVCALRHVRTDGLPRSRLARRWRDLSDDDMTCDELFVQARKPLSSCQI